MSGSDGISVCHVLNAVDETSTEAEWAVQQAARDDVDEVTVVTFFDARPFGGDDAVSVRCLDVPGDDMFPSRSTFLELRRIVSRHSIVHMHHNHSGTFAKLAAAGTGTPAVVTEHNDHAGFTLEGRVGNGLTNPLAAEVVAVSEAVLDSFAWWERALLAGTPVSVVRNGVDVERIERARSLDWSVADVAPVDPDAVLVGSAGMLTEQKAQEVLLEAVDRANRTGDVPIELVVSGRGEKREALERQIANAEFGDRLHLLGFLEDRDHVHKMLHDVDVYAMPSRWEGFCVAALEALAAGNPCVFSDIPPFRDPFADVARFHPVDDAEALAAELVDLAASPAVRSELAERGHEHVIEEYSLQSTVDSYLELYAAHVTE